VFSELKSITAPPHPAFDRLIGGGMTFGDQTVFSIFRFDGGLLILATWAIIALWLIWFFSFLPLYLWLM
jgi:hypothetical protein